MNYAQFTWSCMNKEELTRSVVYCQNNYCLIIEDLATYIQSPNLCKFKTGKNSVERNIIIWPSTQVKLITLV